MTTLDEKTEDAYCECFRDCLLFLAEGVDNSEDGLKFLYQMYLEHLAITTNSLYENIKVAWDDYKHSIVEMFKFFKILGIESGLYGEFLKTQADFMNECEEKHIKIIAGENWEPIDLDAPMKGILNDINI